MLSTRDSRINPFCNNVYIQRYENVRMENRGCGGKGGKADWSNPDSILLEFYRLKMEKGRTPRYREFGGAVCAIERGGYDPEITSYSHFLKSLGEDTFRIASRVYPKKEEVERAFLEMKTELGRVPLLTEFKKKNPKEYLTIHHGKYSNGVHTYSQFMISMGEKANIGPDYWKGHPERVREAYEKFKRDHEPSKEVFKKLYSGAHNAIVKGWYAPGVTSWNEFRKSLGENVNPAPELGKWNPKKVREAYFSLKRELKRNPRQKEFQARHGGAASAIEYGRFNKKVGNWGQFLRFIGEIPEKKFEYWNTQTILKAFYDIKKKLGRVPNCMEFKEMGHGAMPALSLGLYKPDVRKHSEFLKDIGEPPTNPREHYIDSGTVEKSYHALKKKLKRIPLKKEFFTKILFAKKTIESGRYDPSVRSYNGFLEKIGEFNNRWKKNPQKIKEAFYTLKTENKGAMITRNQFCDRYRGAINAIERGEYDPRINSWGGFMRSLGEKFIERKHWDPKKIRMAFYEVKANLGRIPSAKEFEKAFSGAAHGIRRGRYRPEIKKYNEFLSSIGETTLKMNYWNNETIREKFFGLKKKLGRVPNSREFSNLGKGAYSALIRGKYKEGIKKYSQLLVDLGEMPNVLKLKVRGKDRWSRQDMIDAYFILQDLEEKKPSRTAFKNYYGPDPFEQMRKGRIEGIRMWRDLERIVNEDKK